MVRAITTAGNSTLFSPSWAMDSLRAVRDVLQSEGRDDLALAISEAVGGLTAPARHIGDGNPLDFEDSAEWSLDDSVALGPDPDFDESLFALAPGEDLDAIAAELRELLELPPISGGAPYTPTPQDLADYAEFSEQLERKHRAEWMAHMDAIGEGVELDSSHFTEADARAAGLAV